MTTATLLIVEDDGILAANIESLIRELGYGVLGPVATGEEAIDLLRERVADLVLMDIELAGDLNGIETAERIGRFADVPIVFLTGFSQDPLLEQAKTAAPYGYLIKPVPERELAATIAMSLHRHALDRQLKETRFALEMSEARYRHLFEHSPLGIFRTSLEGRMLLTNQEFAEMLGCTSPEETVAFFTDLERLLYVDPADRKRLLDLLHTRGEVRLFRCQWQTKSGAPIWISINARLSAVDEGTGILPVIDGFIQDITEQQRAEEALQESEQRYRTYLTSSPYGVFAGDLAGNFVQVNPAACRLSGYEEHELLAMTVTDLHFPDYHDRAVESFHTVVREGRFQGEMPVRVKGGAQRWWSITAVNVAGRRILGFCSDITERKQAEDALRASEERLQQLFRIAPAGIGVVRDRVFLEVNDRVCEMTGYSAAELVGRDARMVYPAQKDYDFVGHEKYRQIREKGVGEVETRWQRKDGTVIDILMASIPIDPADAGKGTIFTALDITERKRTERLLRESENRYRELVENANSIILRMDSEGRLTFFNEYAQRFFGYSAEEVLGKSVIGTIVPETESTGRNLRAMIDDLGHRPALYATNENENMRRDGSRAWIAWTNKILYDNSGRISELLCVGNDITDRKQAEAEKRHLQAQLDQAQKLEAIGTLAGGIAHDFNNILAAVIGYADISREEVPNGTFLAKNIDQILKAGHRAKDLVKQILAFSRQSSTEATVFMPAIIINEAIKLLRPSLPATITIEQHIDPKAGPICIDPTQFHQILMNLCTNAFHAMEDGGGTLTIGLAAIFLDEAALPATAPGGAGEYAVLSVADTGTGIPEAIRARIFDPFFTTKEAGKGTGMGLSIIHGIVAARGGFIVFDSTVGKGTEFRVHLPMTEQDVGRDHGEAGETAGGSGHILFVDDETMLVEMAANILQTLGYQATALTSSTEALAAFSDNPSRYDLVITDQTMPGMTGLELSRRLLALRPDLPIVLCTGYGALLTKEDVCKHGIRELVLKPLTKKELASVVKKVLNPA